jgi:deoxycytidylate deaminase
MASVPAKSIPLKPVAGTGPKAKSNDLFKKRESPELVIAFSGPVGSGVETVLEQTDELLQAIGYKTVRIKISDYIKECSGKKLIAPLELDGVSEYERIKRLQRGGNELRREYEDNILAQHAVQVISETRIRDQEGPPPDDIRGVVPKKVAYLIDQLKHPSEVKLLRKVYGSLFYLIGVLCIEEKRRKRLEERGMGSSDAMDLMERDRREDESCGQQLDKTLQLADFFVRNSDPNSEALRAMLARFRDLMHGANGLTPTRDEYGMYAAYSASLKSACLSRQVGAAITDSHGNLLATGCNDVPKFGGGLYGPESGSDDARCVKMGGTKCHNDFHKLRLRKQIEDILREQPGLESPPDKAKDVVATIADKIYASSRIKDLIEFSRSVHAEMDAIVSVARKGGASVVGGTLYTTTFPCHNCARHIVAAGIVEVFYIEPYEKSLASSLHEDAISLDKSKSESPNKVRFVHYEGVHPRQYIAFFLAKEDRKNELGKAIFKNVAEAGKAAPEYLNTYMEMETKVVEHLHEIEVPKTSAVPA